MKLKLLDGLLDRQYFFERGVIMHLRIFKASAFVSIDLTFPIYFIK